MISKCFQTGSAVKPAIRKEPQDITVKSSSLTVLCIKSPGSSVVEWYRNGKRLNTALDSDFQLTNDGSLHVINARKERDEGSYHCLVSNGKQSIISRTAEVRFACKCTSIQKGLPRPHIFTLTSILVPIALFASLSRRDLGTRNEGLWRQRILQSQNLGLPVFMYAVVMFLYATRVSNKYAPIFSPPLSIPLFSNSQSKNSKILCLQSPSFLVPRPHRLREAKRAMGTRMINILLSFNTL